MLLAELAAVSAAVRATAARSKKVALLGDLLGRVPPDELQAAVAFLAGDVLERQLGVGYAALRELPEAAAAPGLTIAAVADAFATIATQQGSGSTTERRRLLDDLLRRATDAEQRLLVGLVAGEVRQGAQEGLMTEAIARAASVGIAEVRRAAMLRGDLRAVAVIALADGRAGLAAIRLTVGNPILPMLAGSAESVAAALTKIDGAAAIEWKLDGARIQVHRDGRDVGVFTRSLDEITARVPEVVDAALALPVRSVVLDGEVIALRPDGRPRPFQVTASRVGARTPDLAVPLTALLFDLLHLDGDDLLDRPLRERVGELGRIAPALVVPRADVTDPDSAETFARQALARGHEGVLVKALAAPYEAGRRGAGWLKVKPVETLDLVVLAVDWGSGRRRGWLSNLHLGARNPAGGFVMLGKTFKGMTDAMLAWQTERFLQLEVRRTDWTVHVRPELVVEIAFDGVQASSRYPGGVALRFARVKGYRPDKSAAVADTIDAVRAIHARGV